MLNRNPSSPSATPEPKRGRLKRMPLVLIVEDEPEITKILDMYLQAGGYMTEQAKTGSKALELFHHLKPDLVLLDIMLPELDGIEVLKRIRQISQTPIIMLTAKTEELDSLLGLELGADDYISKPFRPREVVARVKAVLRRSQMTLASTPRQIQLGNLTLDETLMEASIDGKPLDLTMTEFRMLYHMMMHPKRAFSRFELLEVSLPNSEALERVVDTHLRNIRRKLRGTSASECIATVHGIGYKFLPPETS